jgi:hypothetical protein
MIDDGTNPSATGRSFNLLAVSQTDHPTGAFTIIRYDDVESLPALSLREHDFGDGVTGPQKRMNAPSMSNRGGTFPHRRFLTDRCQNALHWKVRLPLGDAAVAAAALILGLGYPARNHLCLKNCHRL